jgi:hypothetical protein
MASILREAEEENKMAKVWAVVSDQGGVCYVGQEGGDDVALVTIDESCLPILREAVERSLALGYTVELKEFDICAPYPMSRPLAESPSAQLHGGPTNPLCQCVNALRTMFCPFGHLTECHFPMNCEQAQCSHLERYQ